MARHVFEGNPHRLSRRHRGAPPTPADQAASWRHHDDHDVDRRRQPVVLKAYVAAVAGFLIYGIPAAIQQHRYSPILKTRRAASIDWTSLVIVALILVIAIVANVTANLRYRRSSIWCR